MQTNIYQCYIRHLSEQVRRGGKLDTEMVWTWYGVDTDLVRSKLKDLSLCHSTTCFYKTLYAGRNFYF